MVRAQRSHLTLVAAALFAGSVAIACGGDGGGGDDNKDAGGGGGTTAGGSTAGNGGEGKPLTVAFNPMYSAFDGNAHRFRVPVKVTGATGALKVSTNPDGFVDSEPAEDGVTLTTRKAGKCTVTIEDAEGNKGTAELTITENDPGDVELGAERYANGNDAFNLPEGGLVIPGLPEGGFRFDGGFPEGGFRLPDGGPFRLPEAGLGSFGISRNPMAACTFCHIPEGATGTTDQGQIDIEHTPTQTAGYSDEDIVKIFTQGEKPMGAGYRIVNGGGMLPDNIAAGIYRRLHRWDVAEPTQRGIVAYLRSLPPKAQGMVDFGGLLRNGGLTGRTGGTGGGSATTMDAGTP